MTADEAAAPGDVQADPSSGPGRPKIVCIGLGKTGTSTVGRCLSSLGYRHRGGPLDLLFDVRAGRLEPVMDVAAAHDSLDDWPWPLVYREVDRRFPGTRFILTERRDTATWFDSLCRHYDRMGPSRHDHAAYGVWSPYDDPVAYTGLYERHGAQVREAFRDRPGDLLVLRLDRGDGWAELGAFLGVPVPDGPLPMVNADDRSSLRRDADHLLAIGDVAGAWQRLVAAGADARPTAVGAMAHLVTHDRAWRFGEVRPGETPASVRETIRRTAAAGDLEGAARLAVANRHEDGSALEAFRRGVRDAFEGAVGRPGLGTRVGRWLSRSRPQGHDENWRPNKSH